MDAFRTQATLFCTFLALGVASWQSWQIARKRRRNPVNWSPVITTLPMISLALLSDRVSEPLDRYLSLNNFSWYLGYSLGVLTCTIVVALAMQEESDPIHHRLGPIILVLGIVALGIMAIIYQSWLRYTTEWVARTPRNGIELVLSLAFFAYGGLITGWGFGHVVTLVRRELNPLVRTRLRIGFVSYVSAHLFFLCKTLYVILSYWWNGFLWLNHLALLLMALTGWIWLVGNLPAVFLRIFILNGPYQVYREMRLLHDLEDLRRRLEQLVPPVSHIYSHSMLDRLLHRTLYIYRATIAILDAKKIMTSYISKLAESRAMLDDLHWSPQQYQEAVSLHAALGVLDEIPGDTLSSITSALQMVAKELRK